MAEKKLLDQVADALRVKHYSYRPGQTYVDWVRRYILFHNKRHPREMGETEVQAFITYLATELNLSASSKNQTLSANLFFYSRTSCRRKWIIFQVWHMQGDQINLSNLKVS
jgi:hypothetical protein